VPPTTEHVIDLTSEAEEPDTIYPTVGELLAELDESMPALGFTHYEGQLLAAGFGYVHQLVDLPGVHTTLTNLQVPIGVVDEMIKRAQRMVRRVAKSKVIVKDEDDANREL
jgi:hypothetical protein